MLASRRALAHHWGPATGLAVGNVWGRQPAALVAHAAAITLPPADAFGHRERNTRDSVLTSCARQGGQSLMIDRVHVAYGAKFSAE